VSIYFSTFPPHPLTPTPTPLVPPYKRGEDRGCFAFVSWRRGTGSLAPLLISCSPLAPLSQAWERGWGRGLAWERGWG